MARSVSKVQQLIKLTEELFRDKARPKSIGDKGFTKDLEKLKQFVGTITADDFNVNSSLAEHKWDYLPYVEDSPAACLEVYECPDFSIGIFLLKPNKTMPLHDHPKMHGIMKLLFGSMTVVSYSRQEDSGSHCEETAPSYEEFLAKCTNTIKMTTDSGACCLYPDNGNIHEIEAGNETAAFLDILGPPYSPSEGRDCNYYYRQKDRKAPVGHEYLKVGSNPEWFSCIPLKHDGLQRD